VPGRAFGYFGPMISAHGSIRWCMMAGGSDPGRRAPVWPRAWVARGLLGLALGAGWPATARAVAGEAGAAPAQVAGAFYDVLLTAMKEGPKLGFEGRCRLLDPEIRRDFNLPLMTRIVVGLPWRNLTAAQQQELVGAFSDFSVANYASEFKDFGGERFLVDPKTTSLPSGDVVVHTKLITGEGETIQLDYLMRSNEGRWQIIDVFLTGTISQLAARRSEFSSVLREGGAAALVKLLKQKTAALKG
jgi:phospholipid transport system substrate-binding protein